MLSDNTEATMKRTNHASPSSLLPKRSALGAKNKAKRHLKGVEKAALGRRKGGAFLQPQSDTKRDN